MNELEQSIPAAEAMIDTEQGGQRKQKNENCLNCGTKLEDVFCHHCGQKDLPNRQTLGELLTNFISSFWSYEGKFFSTIKYLLIKPGFLATEYNAGKRESYYHPARMYVFISFVFFLLLSILPSKSENDKIKISKSNRKKIDFAFADSVQNMVDSIKAAKKNKGDDFTIMDETYSNVKSYDSAQLILPKEKRDNWFEQKMTRKGLELKERYKGKGNEFANEFEKLFLDNFSKVLFWLLPFFALLLKLLYVRRDYFYSEHLVFSIYYYNFFYFAASLRMIFKQVPYIGWIGTIISFWIILYLFFAMKRMYKQSWGKTFLKYLFFLFSFSTLMGIAIAISAIFIFMVI
jgi:Protein of unknown function (DUF3667)